MIIRYKVVRIEEKKKYSLLYTLPLQLQINYVRNQWRRAKIGGLLVFKDWVKVEYFLRNTYVARYPLEIWEVECKHPLELGQNITFKIGAFKNYQFNIAKALKKAWSNSSNKNFSFNQEEIEWPESTEAYKSVRLIKKIMTIPSIPEKPQDTHN